MKYPPITYKLLCDSWKDGENGFCQKNFKRYITEDTLSRENGIIWAGEFDWNWLARVLLNEVDKKTYHLNPKNKERRSNSLEKAELFFDLYEGKKSLVNKMVEQALR